MTPLFKEPKPANIIYTNHPKIPQKYPFLTKSGLIPVGIGLIVYYVSLIHVVLWVYVYSGHQGKHSILALLSVFNATKHKNTAQECAKYGTRVQVDNP